MTEGEQEVESEDVAEVVEVGDVEAPPKAPSRTLLRSLALLTVVSVIGAVAMAVVAARLAGDLDQERDERQSATRVASRFAEVFLTYDFERLDRSKKAVLALSTGKFRREYEQGVGALDQIFQATKSRASVVVKDVFTGQIESDTVSIVVVADQVVEGISGTHRRLDAWLQLDLVKTRSRWLVDGVTSLNFGQPPEGAGANTPPTSSPPPTEPPANG